MSDSSSLQDLHKVEKCPASVPHPLAPPRIGEGQGDGIDNSYFEKTLWQPTLALDIMIAYKLP